MKFTFNKENLLKVVKNCALIVPTKATFPLIRNLKLELVGDYLHINSTNLDLEFFQSYLPENIQNYGKCLIDASNFKKLLEKIDKGNYTFEIKETFNTVQIYNDEAEYSMPILQDIGNEFPEPDMTSEYNSFVRLSSNKLLDTLNKTVFATRNEPSRYQMNGILIKAEEGNENILTFCATDTKRLSLVHVATNPAPEASQNFDDIHGILSTKLCELLIKIIETNFKKQEVFVEIAFKKSKVYIDLCNIQICEKLVNGIFPDYKKAFPSNWTKSPSFNRLQLIKTLEKSMLFTNEETKSIAFHFNHEKVLISSSDPCLGESHFKVPYESKLDQGIDIMKMAFNPRFVLDGLKAINADIVKFDLADPKRPCLITSNDPGFVYLVMPVLPRE